MLTTLERISMMQDHLSGLILKVMSIDDQKAKQLMPEISTLSVKLDNLLVEVSKEIQKKG